MPAPITPQDFSEIRWRGHWIWVPEEPITLGAAFSWEVNSPAKEAHGLFHKTFHLDRVPEQAPARITADSRYILYVNGREVFRGPIRSQPRRLHYDLFDLASYLQPGENVLAIFVKYYGKSKAYWMPAVPNMTMGKGGVLVFEANLGAPSPDTQEGWLVSDASWKAKKSDAWLEPPEAGDAIGGGGGIPIEIFDASRFPYDWEQPGFDDAAWGNAQIVPAVHIGGFARTHPPTDPYGPLYPRSIAQLGGEVKAPTAIRIETLEGQVDAAIGSPVKRVEAAAGLPVSGTTQAEKPPLTLDVPASGMVRLILDMGCIVSGFVEFELDAPVGTVLDLSYVEEPVTGPSRQIGLRVGTRYIARGENDRFQVFDSNGFRYAYLLIHDAPGPVILKSFSVKENLYPWTTGPDFTCDDDELNRIFTAGIRTVQLNSQDSFTDCPTREQRAFVGDGVVHQMVHLATNCDWRLAWHYLTLGNSPRSDGILPMSVAGDIEAGGGFTLPDWSLHWVHGVYNRYRFSGDQDAVKELMPTVERILRWYAPYQTLGGVLKDVVEWNLVDWSSVSTEDTSAVLTALWARGLREFSEMAAWLEERGSYRWADRLYEKARSGFAIFWDELRGSYVDHIVDGVRRPEMCQLAGALAIVSRLAPEARWGRIVDTITDPARLVARAWTTGDDELQKLQKQFQGIYEIDWDAEQQIVLAEPFMQYVVHDAVALAGRADRLPDLYRRWSEFLVGGYDTIGENWGHGTHVHGWSCTPTKDMVFYTLGVTPAEPGYTKARIAPSLGSLAWAKGSVPTPHGLISVKATADSVTVDSPVPIVVEFADQPPRTLPPGRHELSVR